MIFAVCSLFTAQCTFVQLRSFLQNGIKRDGLVRSVHCTMYTVHGDKVRWGKRRVGGRGRGGAVVNAIVGAVLCSESRILVREDY